MKIDSQIILFCWNRKEGVPVISETFVQFIKISLRLVKVQKFFSKNYFEVLTAIIFKSFQQKSTNTFSHDSILGQNVCLAWVIVKISQ